jgi:hypothetical protein
MADTPASSDRPASPGARAPHQRRARELIDEMLASIRAATSRELWSTDERTQYERELGEIMTRVRAEAVRRAAPGDGG